MICTNQFLHTQIIIIVPRIGNALFDKRNHRSDLEKYNSMVIILPHRLELSHFKKSGDYGNGTRRYRCLDCGKAFSPLTGTVFDAHKIPISEWIEYMIHLFKFHFLSSSAIKEDMDFLNDIDKESLTDAPDTRISTSMSFKVKNKEVKIETTQKYNRLDTWYQTFLFVSFDILFVFLL